MLDQAAIDGGFEFHPALLIGSHAFLRISSQHDRNKPVPDLIRDGTRFSDKIMRQFI
jgi:hypothetical protein